MGAFTQVPSAHYIAIERSRKVVLPAFPEILLVFVSKDILNLGQMTVIVQGCEVQMYDMERSVCDAVKYRNKIGIDVMAEILRSYMKRPERSIERLLAYAAKLRVKNIIKRYMEIEL